MINTISKWGKNDIWNNRLNIAKSIISDLEDRLEENICREVSRCRRIDNTIKSNISAIELS